MGKWRTTMVMSAIAAALMTFQASAQEKFKAVTTFTIIADMAKNVAGDVAEVESITKPGAEIHEYQPTPGDIKRAQGAKLILANGMNLELWFQKLSAPERRTGSGGDQRHYADGDWQRTLSGQT